jgi:hypothetical protein
VAEFQSRQVRSRTPLPKTCHPEAVRGICFLCSNGTINREKNRNQRAASVFRQGTASAVPKKRFSSQFRLRGLFAQVFFSHHRAASAIANSERPPTSN